MDSPTAHTGGPSAAAGGRANLRHATDAADRLGAYRLRYDVYVAEQGKTCPDADHERRLLSDELDAEAELIVAEIDGVIVGTVRANYCTSPAVLARYAHEFEIERLPGGARDEMSVCSRLAIRPECRDMVVRRGLFDAVYATGMTHGARLCFATCAPALLRMFRRVGFREYLAPIVDPYLGLRHRILLVMDDLAHLERVHSPFLPTALQLRVVPRERRALTDLLRQFEASHAQR